MDNVSARQEEGMEGHMATRMGAYSLRRVAAVGRGRRGVGFTHFDCMSCFDRDVVGGIGRN